MIITPIIKNDLTSKNNNRVNSIIKLGKINTIGKNSNLLINNEQIVKSKENEKLLYFLKKESIFTSKN